MYCYNIDYIDLPAPLSPIYEEDEEPPVPADTEGGACSEANNSSNGLSPVTPAYRSVTSDKESTYGNPPDSQERRGYIESHSGRRQDVTEVLKQKYINNDIQDLPRVVPGPVRYGRLHRSRASRVNLASMDIRAQMNRLRLQNLEQAMQEGRNQYRCRKFNSFLDVDKLKSLQDMLRDDFSPVDDEYDHEVAAICHSYSGEMLDGRDLMALNGRCSLGHSEVMPDTMAERFLDYEVDKETKSAFWKGFAEGVRRSTTSANETELLNETIENQKRPKEVTEDPALEADNHKNIIDNNQDVTHKSLRDWEHGLRVEKNITLPPLDVTKCNLPSGSVYNQHFQISKTTDMDKDGRDINSGEMSQAKCTNIKVVPRRALPLAMTYIDVDLPVSNKDNKRLQRTGRTVKDSVSSDDSKVTDARDLVENSTLVGNAAKTNNDVNRRESKRIQEKNNVSLLPNFHSHDREQNLPIYMHLYTKAAADEHNIITMAKERLENRTFSSLHFEKDCRQASETNNPESNTTDSSTPHVKLEDLHGWTTQLKSYSDNLDNIRLSSSEHLHPVDSSVTVDGTTSSARSPWKSDDAAASQSNASPIESPITIKMRKRGKSISKLARSSDHNIRTPERLSSSSARGTPTNASIYDLSEKTVGKTVFETNAFKPARGTIAPFLGVTRSVSDCKPKTKVSTMRFTKSMNDFHAMNEQYKKNTYRNTPTLRCQNYNTEKKLMSKITANINLSETLAKQLKTIGKDRIKVWNSTKEIDSRFLTRSPEEEPTDSLLHVTELPTVGGKGLFAPGVVKESKFSDNTSVFTLPKIPLHGSKTITNRKQKQGSDEGEKCPKYVDLPPIGVRSLQNTTSHSPVGYKEMSIDDWPKSLPMRIEVCTSPYLFDKASPRNLHVTARPLKNIHSVCTSCGNISETPENTSGHEKPNKVVTSSQNSSQKTASHKCADDTENDAKWHLEGESKYFNQNMPDTNTTKLTEHLQKTEQLKPVQCKPDSKIYSKPHKKTNPKQEELSFNFMDQHIKIKFECEFSLKNQGNDTAENNNKDISRIQSLAIPRENMHCPVERETRIYKEPKKKSKPNSPSPYIEYCKRKTKLRSVNSERYKEEFLNMITDTFESDMANKEVHKKRNTPIIKKKSEEKLKQMKERRWGLSSSDHNSPIAVELSDLCVTSEPLVLLKNSGSPRIKKAVSKEANIKEFTETETIITHFENRTA